MPKLWENKAPFITLTKNYVRVLIKQKKTKTECLRGLLVFVLKLGPFEKPFHKLGLLVSPGFLNTWKQFSCVWKPSWNTRSRLWNTNSLYISKKSDRHQIGWAPKVFEPIFFDNNALLNWRSHTTIRNRGKENLFQKPNCYSHYSPIAYYYT